MNTEIKFTNEFGHEITQQQVEIGLSCYHKKYYENGTLVV